MRFEAVSGRSRRRALIGLTPLIDVVFILLLFFMLASNFSQWRSIDVMTPATGNTARDDEKPLLIRIEHNGSISLDGTPLALESLNTAAAADLKNNPQRLIIVQPEPQVALQTIVDVLERLHAAAGRHIALQRTPEQER